MDRSQVPAENAERVDGWLGSTRLGTNWIDVSGSAFVITDVDPLCGGNLNRLLAVSPTNPYAASGQYLASLENLYSLDKLDWQIPAVMPAIDLWHYLLRENVKTIALPSPILSFDQILAIFAGTSKDLAYVATDSVALAASSAHVAAWARNLARRRFLRRLRSTRRRVHCSIARFCALSWSRRLWYLLHGSHPLKTECRQAFGCA